MKKRLKKRKKEKCGHKKVHRKKRKKRERNIAMLSNKRWRKNHIMLWSNHDHPTPTHMHILI